ncbi:hypothetical protein LTR56_019696 [Elasticomyces elasticus]|nr:hypothetical protein LTR56_019696 [Elasticomyces elasticus]KAK3633997.1 hypothetical protein LTR22_019864 [Elasticomyces elasticus]KAK5750664.1 hypothetical protein LTS12_019285 [Elasticomyces elasticus]
MARRAHVPEMFPLRIYDRYCEDSGGAPWKSQRNAYKSLAPWKRNAYESRKEAEPSADGTDETDGTDEAYETNETKETNETSERNEADEIKKRNERNETGGSHVADGAHGLDQAIASTRRALALGEKKRSNPSARIASQPLPRTGPAEGSYDQSGEGKQAKKGSTGDIMRRLFGRRSKRVHP